MTDFLSSISPVPFLSLIFLGILSRKEVWTEFSYVALIFLLPSLVRSQNFTLNKNFNCFFVVTLVLWQLFAFSSVRADVTIYGHEGNPAKAAPTPCIGAVACDNLTLVPVGLSNTQTSSSGKIIPVQLNPTTHGVFGLSYGIPPDFFGFSFEMSVVENIFGTDGVDPVLLNLLSNVVSRSKRLTVRVGGNTQEKASFVPAGLPKGALFNKTTLPNDGSQFRVILDLAPALIYAMANVSHFLPSIEWFLGVPFNDTNDPRPELAQFAQDVLGNSLIGLQLGNEPDIYGSSDRLRPSDYSPEDYDREWGEVLKDYIQDPQIKNSSMFIAPSVCCGDTDGWWPEKVWDTGFLEHYADNLAFVSIQYYPGQNCNGSTNAEAQDALNSIYLNHSSVQASVAPYLNSSMYVRGFNKPFIMMETNSASCGGFQGVSDTFGVLLWAIDYALNMAAGSFSKALFHVGGSSDYYNAFTPPATNQSRFRSWTVGSMYYAPLVIAEALSSDDHVQVADLLLEGNSIHTPGYVIYEQGTPVRVLLINYMTDTTGAGNYTAQISIGGGSGSSSVPSSVRVKYLLAPSTVEKFNISWAGQNMGAAFGSDGRLQGTEMTYTYQCDTTKNVCSVPVPAPGAALVFLNSNGPGQANFAIESMATFSTSTSMLPTDAANTATVAQAVLATSNGRGGKNWAGKGSTSFGSEQNALANAAGRMKHLTPSFGTWAWALATTLLQLQLLL